MSNWEKVANETAPLDTIKSAFDKVNSLIDCVTQLMKHNNIVTVIGTYIVTVNDLVLHLNGSEDFTVTLYTAVGNTGNVLIFKKICDPRTCVVTIDGSGSETIEGVTSIDLVVDNSILVIYSDGANWRILHRRDG